MNEDYSQPFYVGIKNSRFRGVSRDGYLRVLEPKEETGQVDDVIPTPAWAKAQWDYVLQLSAKVNYLNNKILELRAKKVKGKY